MKKALLQMFFCSSIIQVVQKSIESKCKWFKVVEKIIAQTENGEGGGEKRHQAKESGGKVH